MTTMTTPVGRGKAKRPQALETWDHDARCTSRLIAERRRDDLRTSSPMMSGDRRVRYRVRRCPTCHLWFVMRELRRPGE